jgi:hypothetical protein
MPRQMSLTPVQNIAINLIFGVIGEPRYNRTLSEYAAIAAKLHPLKILVYEVNQRLELVHQHNADSGIPLPVLLPFKAGDERIFYEPYPRKISYETVRKALEVFGLRAPRGGRAKSL